MQLLVPAQSRAGRLDAQMQIFPQVYLFIYFVLVHQASRYEGWLVWISIKPNQTPCTVSESDSKVRWQRQGEFELKRKSERGLKKERGGLKREREEGLVKEDEGVQFHSSRCQLWIFNVEFSLISVHVNLLICSGFTLHASSVYTAEAFQMLLMLMEQVGNENTFLQRHALLQHQPHMARVLKKDR